MRFTSTLNAFLLLASSIIVRTSPLHSEVVGAAYFMSDAAEQENHVIVHSVFSNGTVSYANAVSTGGLGGSYQNMTFPIDTLNSVGSVVVGGDRLYVVNAGSNSITTFMINSQDPTQLQQIGKPVNSGGDFPVSIAVSKQTSEVCVLNAGKNNGIQCFRPESSGLVTIPNSNRSLNLPETQPPTLGPSFYSVSEVSFSPDGSKLVTSVKGVLTTGAPGYLAAWDVNHDGSLSLNHSTYFPPTKEAQMNFGFTYLSGSEGYVVSEGNRGAVLYDFSKGYDPKNVVSKNVIFPGEMASSCWVAYSTKSQTYFFTDPAGEAIYEYAVDANLDAEYVTQYNLTQALFVPIDSAIGTIGDNQYLYQLTSLGTSLIVFDIETRGKSTLTQIYDFQQSLFDHGLRSTPEAQGLALYFKN